MSNIINNLRKLRPNLPNLPALRTDLLESADITKQDIWELYHGLKSILTETVVTDITNCQNRECMEYNINIFVNRPSLFYALMMKDIIANAEIKAYKAYENIKHFDKASGENSTAFMLINKYYNYVNKDNDNENFNILKQYLYMEYEILINTLTYSFGRSEPWPWNPKILLTPVLYLFEDTMLNKNELKHKIAFKARQLEAKQEEDAEKQAEAKKLAKADTLIELNVPYWIRKVKSANPTLNDALNKYREHLATAEIEYTSKYDGINATGIYEGLDNYNKDANVKDHFYRETWDLLDTFFVRVARVLSSDRAYDEWNTGVHLPYIDRTDYYDYAIDHRMETLIENKVKTMMGGKTPNNKKARKSRTKRRRGTKRRR